MYHNIYILRFPADKAQFLTIHLSPDEIHYPQNIYLEFFSQISKLKIWKSFFFFFPSQNRKYGNRKFDSILGVHLFLLSQNSNWKSENRFFFFLIENLKMENVGKWNQVFDIYIYIFFKIENVIT